MSDQGILMTGYKEVRRTLGTVHYPYQGRPNLYDAIRTHPSLVLEQGDGGKKKKKGRAKKIIEIVAKRDKMKDLLDLTAPEKDEGEIDDVKPTDDGGKEGTDKPGADQNGKEDMKEDPYLPMTTKTIRVSNIKADKKKGELII